MALIVQKYGGTSVGSIERILAVAEKVKRAKDDRNDVVVAVAVDILVVGIDPREGRLGLAHQTQDLLAVLDRLAFHEQHVGLVEGPAPRALGEQADIDLVVQRRGRFLEECERESACCECRGRESPGPV